MKTSEQPRISRRTLLRRGAALTTAGLGLAGFAWFRLRETDNAPESVSWFQLHNNQAVYEGHRIQIVTYGVVGTVVDTIFSDTDIFQGTLQNTSQIDVTSIVEMYNSREVALATRDPNTQPGSIPLLIAVDSEKAAPAIPYIQPNTRPTMKVDPSSAAIALYQLTGTWTKNTGQIVFSPQTIPYFLAVEQAAILQKIS